MLFRRTVLSSREHREVTLCMCIYEIIYVYTYICTSLRVHDHLASRFKAIESLPMEPLLVMLVRGGL